MRKMIVALLLIGSFAGAQTVELGATVGGGTFGAEDTGLPAFVAAGVETCVLCGRRFGVFGEYIHWERAGGSAIRYSGIPRADVIAGGLRIQGGRSVRPFFDVGVAGGWDQFDVFGGGRKSHGNAGVALGGGVAVSIRGGWYVRPQARMFALGGPHGGFLASVGVGYRFLGR